MKKKIVCLVICALFLTTILPVSGSDTLISAPLKSADVEWWPMLHHDSARTGFSSSAAPDQLIINFSSIIGFASYQSPVVVNERVFVGATSFTSDLREIQCYDAGNGDHKWTVSTGNRPVDTAPAVYEGKVYVGLSGPPGHGDEGLVWCLDAETGDEVWNFSTYPNSYGHSSPCIYEAKLYIGAGRFVYCLNATTGAYIWRYHTVQTVYDPAVFNDRVYICSGGAGMPPYGKVYCLDAEGNGNGTTSLIWEYQTEMDDDVYKSPTVAYDNVYFTLASKRLVCLFASNGTVKWSSPIEGGFGDCAAAYNTIYVASGSPPSHISCVNASTGAEVWSSTIPGINTCGPAVADGKLFITSSGKIYCLNAYEGGPPLWEIGVGSNPSSSPAVANGKLYVCLDGYGLVCFGGANHPPGQPLKPLGRTTGNVGEEYLFSTSTTDTDYNTIQYGWDWNGDSIVDTWTDFYPSGDAADTIHTWNEAGSYQVRVKAKDVNGGESGWSEPLEITISYDLVLSNILGGFRVRAEVFNQGIVTVDNVICTIRFTDGFVLFPIGRSVEIPIGSISAEESIVVKTFVCGFGNTEITIELEASGYLCDSKTVPASVFLCFVKVMEEP